MLEDDEGGVIMRRGKAFHTSLAKSKVSIEGFVAKL